MEKISASLVLFLLFSMVSTSVRSQTVSANINQYAVAYAPTDKLLYTPLNLPVSNYSLGFYLDPWQTGAPTTYISGFGGLKIFTAAVMRLAIPLNGNLGVGTANPTSLVQLGDYGSGGTNSLTIPGTYNFEQVRLGQFGNGAGGLELINHVSASQSYGIRLIANLDQAQGLQIQYTPAYYTAYPSVTYATALFVDQTTGDIGINTLNTKGYKLAVNGSVVATQVVVKTNSNWPDYVFRKGYQLPAINDFKKYILKNGHLPDMPTAKEIRTRGVDIEEMEIKLLKKVEELSLLLIKEHETSERRYRLIKKQQKMLEQPRDGEKR